jgi:heat shock protein HtpX
MMKRIILFLGTSIAVLLVLAVASQLLGLDSYLDAQSGIDFTSLLIAAGIIGFSGSLIFLAMSKAVAK